MPECFSKDIIVLGLEAQTPEGVIRVLGNLLHIHGFVKDSFCDAVIEREKIFATGLPVDPMGVAIPHTDADHVLKMGVAVGVLKSPVKFGLMGGEGEICVDLVFLLALDNCQSQIAMLQSIAEFVNKDGLVKQIRKAKTKATVLEVLKKEISLELHGDCN
ncbi:MAG TPA: PTS sugar transporter subunit IIA [Pelolinea sp.]|nr:PTS sugar transporter subunit IIA [Pelolinea sp.]